VRKIFIIVATRCHLLWPKSIEFDFGWSSVSDPTGGAHSVPLKSLAKSKKRGGLLLKVRKKEKGEKGRSGELR